MIKCMLFSSVIISKSLLWIRISNLAQVAVPWPETAFLTTTFNLLVGRGMGPYFLMPVFLQTLSSCSHTDFKDSKSMDDKRIRAFCMFRSLLFKIYESYLYYYRELFLHKLLILNKLFYRSSNRYLN